MIYGGVIFLTRGGGFVNLPLSLPPNYQGKRNMTKLVRYIGESVESDGLVQNRVYEIETDMRSIDGTIAVKIEGQPKNRRWVAPSLLKDVDVTKPDSPAQGIKHDEGKVRLDLLPLSALEEVGKVLTFGSGKYGDWNWAKGMEWKRLQGAAMRHLFAWGKGEQNDPETGLSHLAHLACCVLFLLHYQKFAVGTDDRFIEKKINESA